MVFLPTPKTISLIVGLKPGDVAALLCRGGLTLDSRVTKIAGVAYLPFGPGMKSRRMKDYHE
jgi:hypothetical protein